ncbi:ImmA/IrrE family metallo-endopeptidase [Aquitalea sp. USM4]|uniref:helix-turn-helix domain-containing protein n=1 Tax=Aquitalea sp. USM4 TaxID=1590041 RepID=UPI00103E0726|nr:XRE family transcriptional regulator [Aquitalea sp. USM4]QBJ80266.1 transcriptional regulator [Aquitalea sp. USM4]
MIGERLLRARKAAGLSLRALADAVDLSQTAINKYEKGELTPSSGQLLKIAKVLGVRTEYFLRSTSLQLEGIEYRKRASTSKTILDRISVDITDQAERWIELLSLYPQPPVSKFALPERLPERISSEEEIELAAEILRQEWGLGTNPIPDLIDTLESHGIMVIVTAVDGLEKFDGLAASVAGIPIVVVAKNWPGDRQRFTLAHELGHLVLHDRLAENLDEEKACNRFAGALLLPQGEVVKVMGTHRTALEVRELYMLKHEFGISMLGVLFRIKQAGVITESICRSWFMEFSKQGWRKGEPGDQYAHEDTYLFQGLVYRALAEGYIGESKAAELLKISLTRFKSERKLEGLHAATDQ